MDHNPVWQAVTRSSAQQFFASERNPKTLRFCSSPPTGPHVGPKQSSPHLHTSLHQHCAFMSTDLSHLVSTLWSLNWYTLCTSHTFKHSITAGSETSHPAWVHHISIIYWKVRCRKLLLRFLFPSFTLNIENFLYVEITLIIKPTRCTNFSNLFLE